MELTQIIGNKYKLLEKIGDGSFGLIFKGQNIRTGELVAIKIELIDSDTKLLKNESIIYQYLNDVSGIPSVKWYGKDTNNYYMVISLLGNSLQTIKNIKTRFSLKLTLQIGFQAINLLKSIHEKGLVHRDIKPDNFLLGTNDKVKTIYIIDFGFCKTFSREEKKTNSLIGSPMYASINAHNLVELTRRDDLESLGYMLIYFYLGSLDWQENNLSNIEYISLKEKLIENNNLPEVLINYLKYVRRLAFVENPNYYLLLDSFKREIEKE